MKYRPDSRQEGRMKFIPLCWLMVALIISGCGSNEPVRIGFIAGTSGRVADLGLTGMDAVQMAVEEWNNKGGINGRPIRLLIKDDKQDADTAKKMVQELLDAKVEAVIGPMTSSMSVAVKPLFDQARIAFVSPTSTSQVLSGQNDYFFRVTSTTKEFASKNAAYHIKIGDMKRICAIYDLSNKVFCENWLDNFTALFTAEGGEILNVLSFQSGRNESFPENVRKALEKSPDGILIIANSMDSALLCQQIRKFDPNIPITLADWGATERLLELGGRAVEGVTVVQTFNRDHEGKVYQDFRTRYIDRYKREPGFPGVYAYDAAQVVLNALKHQRANQDIKDVILSQKKFPGLQVEIVFDEFGDVSHSNASISIVKNNSFVVLE